MKALLVVAGQDPSYRIGWGAGVDADREAAARFGVEARCVVTARTDQDGTRVRALGARPVAEWVGEARAAAEAPFQALKSGLLPGAAHVRALAALLAELDPARTLPVVVDPVLSASGGEPFLDDEGVRVLLGELVPRGVVLTPNLPEAARLTGRDPLALAADRGARVDAARELLERGARAVVLKGGHADDAELADLVLARGAEPVWLPRPRTRGARLHGSGCRHASALAAGLALGRTLPAAAEAAGAWLGELLLRARPE